jgi:hypothetical protein
MLNKLPIDMSEVSFIHECGIRDKGDRLTLWATIPSAERSLLNSGWQTPQASPFTFVITVLHLKHILYLYICIIYLFIYLGRSIINNTNYFDTFSFYLLLPKQSQSLCTVQYIGELLSEKRLYHSIGQRIFPEANKYEMFVPKGGPLT